VRVRGCDDGDGTFGITAVIRGSNPRTAVAQDLFILSLAERSRAVRLVASAADDAADCVLLLDVLGLDPLDGRSTDR
jgi:hypothetical protein